MVTGGKQRRAQKELKNRGIFKLSITGKEVAGVSNFQLWIFSAKFKQIETN